MRLTQGLPGPGGQAGVPPGCRRGHRLAYHLILQRTGWTSCWSSSCGPPSSRSRPCRWSGSAGGSGPTCRSAPIRGTMPDRLYKPHWRELSPFVRVEGIEWAGRQAGHLRPARSSRRWTSPGAGNASKIVVLVPRRRGRLPIVVPARSARAPVRDRLSGQERYSYDWAGFRCRDQPPLAPDRRASGCPATGTPSSWSAGAASGARRGCTPRSPGRPSGPSRARSRPASGSGAYWVGLQLQVQVELTPAVLSGCPERR